MIPFPDKQKQVIINLLEEIDHLTLRFSGKWVSKDKKLEYDRDILDKARQHLKNVKKVLHGMSGEISEERAKWIYDEFFKAKELFGEDLGATENLQNPEWRENLDFIWDRLLAVMDSLMAVFQGVQTPEAKNWFGGKSFRH